MTRPSINHWGKKGLMTTKRGRGSTTCRDNGYVRKTRPDVLSSLTSGVEGEQILKEGFGEGGGRGDFD